MIGRGFWRGKPTESEEPRGFDAFELRLGDLMRGERATLGKSLLDVQRELKIKAAYIAAIENCDPTAFDTPGFIAGYVRSYARYLNMDPDWAFETFCRESGFQPVHGMSPSASSVRPAREDRVRDHGLGKDIFSASMTPYLPKSDSLFSGLEPRALGSILVLVALIGGLGYGAWVILQEVQKVQFAPVEQAPTVIAEVDPLAGASRDLTAGQEDIAALFAPSAEALDRLYRPQALDLPVLVPRDGPIAAVNPASVGALAPAPASTAAPGTVPLAVPQDDVERAVAAALGADIPLPAVQVTEAPAPAVQIVAVRPAWVRVRAADGSILFEGILNPGDTYDVPQTEQPPTLRVGESGSVYFAVNGAHHGPVGPRGTVTSNIPLSAEAITATYALADLSQDADLAEFVRVAQAAAAAAE
jgi:cytoskeletal protein RodZ